MFEKYALCFTRTHASTAEKLAAKIKYSPELGDAVSMDPNTHIDRCVYNPNLSIVPYLEGKISMIDAVMLRRITEFTRLKYFTSFDVNYGSAEFPVVTDHYKLPVLNEPDEKLVLKYITKNNGFRNIKKVPFVESEWDKKKVTFLPDVEEMYSHFINLPDVEEMYSHFIN